MDEEMSPHPQMQAGVMEIADVLAKRQGKSMQKVWEKALSQHRVRFETEILPPPDEKSE